MKTNKKILALLMLVPMIASCGTTPVSPDGPDDPDDPDVPGDITLEEAREMLATALNADYSNSTSDFYGRSYDELSGSVEEEVLVYNYDGYNIAYTPSYAETGFDPYLYYHDYQDVSHLYFEYDYGNGPAWCPNGRIGPVGLENTYFSTSYIFSHIDVDDFQYNFDYDFFYLTDDSIIEEKYNSIFVYCMFNYIDAIYIDLTADDSMVKVIQTVDDEEDMSDSALLTNTSISDVGTTSFTGELPPAPNADNVKDFWDYSGEEEPVDKDVTSISVDFASSEEDGVIELDEEIEIVRGILPEDANTYQFETIIESANNAVSVEHSFTANQYVVKGLCAGSAKVSIKDKTTGVVSNELEITVNPLKDSEFKNRLYDCDVELVSGNAVLTNYDDNGNVATIAFGEDARGARLAASDNQGLIANVDVVAQFSVNSSVNLNSGTDFENIVYADVNTDKPINALSFAYGIVFDNQVSNAKGKNYSEAKIYVSDDGENYSEDVDWTNDLNENASSLNLKRQDIRLSKSTQHVRIAFCNHFIGKNYVLGFKNIQLFLED